jgi:hypothetical protein
MPAPGKSAGGPLFYALPSGETVLNSVFGRCARRGLNVKLNNFANKE